MIATGVIETIIYKQIKSNAIFGVFPEIEKGDLASVTEENNHERISIRCNASDNTDWQHSFAYVYIYVPDKKDLVNNAYRKNDAKLNQYEKEADVIFKHKTFDNSTDETFYYQLDSIKKEKEAETWSHVITVKLRVTNSNFKL